MVVEWNLRNVITGIIVKISGDDVCRAGRSSDFEIVCLSKRVSRIHAQFTVEDGNLYVEDMKSANGTYINSKQIVQKEQIHHGNIVSLGLLDTTCLNNHEPFYVFEVVKKHVDVPEKVLNAVLLENDEEVVLSAVNNNINQMESSPQQDISNVPDLKMCNGKELLTSLNLTGSCTTGCVQLDQKIQIKKEIPDIPVCTPAKYSIEDDVIVIEDDDEDCNFSSSQRFTTATSSSVANEALLSKVKLELVEMCGDDDVELVVIDDSDSDNDWLGSEDITAQINKIEQELNLRDNDNINVIKDGILLNVPETEKSNSNVESLVKITSACTTSKYIKPPIIEPTQMLCKEKVNVKVYNEAQKTSVKRKSKGEEDTGRKKLKSSKTKNDKGTLSKLQVSSRNNKRNLDIVDKKEKEKIKQIRKEKLKELEMKNTDKNATEETKSIPSIQKEVAGSSKMKQANVKVSDGRGNFLLDIESEVLHSVQRRKQLQMKNTDKNETDEMKSISTVQKEVTRSCKMKKGNDKDSNSIAIENARHDSVQCRQNKVINRVAVPSKQNHKENLIMQITEKETVTLISSKNSRDPRIFRREAKREPVLINLKPRNVSNKHVHDGINNNEVHNINKNNNLAVPLLSLDVILNIISWKTAWLKEQCQLSEPPPVTERTPVKMCHSFSSHDDYCNIVNPLLTLELWNIVYKEWLLTATDETRQQSRTFSGRIESVEPGNNYLLLKSTVYITKQQKDTRNHVKQCDVIIIQLPLISQNNLVVKRMFAYVSSCSRKLFHGTDNNDEYLAKKLPAMPDSTLALDIMIRSISETIDLEKHIESRIITSLISFLREFDAVKALGNSPLCKYILDPQIEDYLVRRIHSKRIISKDNLCKTQQQVVLEAISLCLQDNPGIYLIQGPPGTGKTTVIANIVQNILLNDKIKEPRVLLLAPSNAAVDGLILKINKHIKPHLTEDQRRKIKLLRIGPKHVIHDEVKPYFVDELAKVHVKSNFFAEFPEVQKDYCQLCRDIQALGHERGRGYNFREKQKQLQDLIHKQQNFAQFYLKQKYFERFCAAKNKLIEGANVICTTLSSCIRLEDYNFSLGKITCCIVDEATQSKEPETLIPLMLGVTKLILVGDPRQLPAVTVSQHAKELGHGQSLFARIKHHFDNKPLNPIRMLNVQYRMHPEISLFPNNNFYNGKLLNAPTYIQREGLNKLAAYYVFNLNSKSMSNKSYTNEDEVDCVLKLLEAITSTVGSKSIYSVGIITPYNTQKDALNERLTHYSNNLNMSISVNTVDSFQGSEKDIIILSCVRYNPNNFLSNEQRLNVAITRAKHALYIIGTYSLFQHCNTLSKIKRDAENRNLYLNINCTVNTNLLQAVITRKKATYFRNL